MAAGTKSLPLKPIRRSRINSLNPKAIAFPLFHPARVIYQRNLEPVIEDDFRKLGQLLKDAGLRTGS